MSSASSSFYDGNNENNVHKMMQDDDIGTLHALQTLDPEKPSSKALCVQDTTSPTPTADPTTPTGTTNHAHLSSAATMILLPSTVNNTEPFDNGCSIVVDPYTECNKIPREIAAADLLQKSMGKTPPMNPVIVDLTRPHSAQECTSNLEADMYDSDESFISISHTPKHVLLGTNSICTNETFEYTAVMNDNDDKKTHNKKSHHQRKSDSKKYGHREKPSMIETQSHQGINRPKHGDESSYFDDMFLSPFLEAHYLSQEEWVGYGPFLRRCLSYIRDEKRNSRTTMKKKVMGKISQSQVQNDCKKKTPILPMNGSSTTTMMTTVTTVKNEHSKSSTMNQRIVYHFLYYYPRSENDVSSSSFQDFTVDQKDNNCLLCHFQCRKVESLMMHYKLNHGNMLHFEDSIDNRGNVSSFVYSCFCSCYVSYREGQM